MKTYYITLSMGHDTGVVGGGAVEAESVDDAYHKLWKEMREKRHDEIERCYRAKGVRYAPYFHVQPAWGSAS